MIKAHRRGESWSAEALRTCHWLSPWAGLVGPPEDKVLKFSAVSQLAQTQPTFKSNISALSLRWCLILLLFVFVKDFCAEQVSQIENNLFAITKIHSRCHAVRKTDGLTVQSVDPVMKKKNFKLDWINTNKIKSGGKKKKSLATFLQADFKQWLFLRWGESVYANVSWLRCRLRSALTRVNTETCVTSHNHLFGGFVLVREEPAVASLIISLMCGHSGFTPLALAQSGALESAARSNFRKQERHHQRDPINEQSDSLLSI